MQSSLVINIVGTDDISQLPRLGTCLTEVGWGGGRGLVNTLRPPLSCVHSSVCLYLASSQYLDMLLSFWLGLSLVPHSCLIPSFAAVASTTGP
jgi:hypothetical protein